MSILNNANDIKLGSNQVTGVYVESTLIWPTSFWNFSAPVSGDELTVLVEPSAEINWGDGNTETLANSALTTHTYTTGFIPNSFNFSVPGDVINFTANRLQSPGDAIFGGVINVASLPNLEILYVTGHDLTNIIGVNQATNIRIMNVLDNELDGNIKQYMPPNTEEIQIRLNPIDEPIPDNTLAEFTSLRIIAAASLSNMGGSFPTLPTSIEEIGFGFCGMSGDLPSLTSYTNLNRLWVYLNNFGIPSGWAVPASLTNCDLSNNSLTSTEVDRTLIAFDNAGASNGTIYLGGNNAAPTGTGITAKNSLISKGWTVNTS